MIKRIPNYASLMQFLAFNGPGKWASMYGQLQDINSRYKLIRINVPAGKGLVVEPYTEDIGFFPYKRDWVDKLVKEEQILNDERKFDGEVVLRAPIRNFEDLYFEPVLFTFSYDNEYGICKPKLVAINRVPQSSMGLNLQRVQRSFIKGGMRIGGVWHQ